MNAYSLLLGARNTPGAGQHFRPEDDALIREITFRHFPSGFTVLHADGGWYDPERGFIEEESREIRVCAARASELRPWCEALTEALQQKELLLVRLGPAAIFKAKNS